MRGYRFEIPRAHEPKASALVGQHVAYDGELFVVIGVKLDGPAPAGAIMLIRKTRSPSDFRSAANVVDDFEPSRVLPWPEDW